MALQKAVFLIQSALQQNAMKGYFCFGLADLEGNWERGEQTESYSMYHSITLAMQLREHWQQPYYTVLFSEIYNLNSIIKMSSWQKCSKQACSKKDLYFNQRKISSAVFLESQRVWLRKTNKNRFLVVSVVLLFFLRNQYYVKVITIV